MAAKAELAFTEDQTYLRLTLDEQQADDMRIFWKCFAQLRYYHYRAVLKTGAFRGS